MNFFNNFVKKKYYMYIILVIVLLICTFSVVTKASSNKYSKQIEVKQYTISKIQEPEEVIEVEIVEENFIVGENEENKEEEEVKVEDGNATYKGVTVEIPKVVVAKVNDAEDKKNQVSDSSTSNAKVVSVEETIEQNNNTGKAIGIDVSKWQGDINWSEVKKSGIEFAIIRIGYRGSSQGSIVMDPYFQKNISGATANGIKVGVYFFSMAINEEEAIQEAAWTIENAKKYRVTYPIVYDFESWGVGRAAGISNEQVQKNALSFLGYVNASGYSGMMYGSKNALKNRFTMGSFSSYKIWLAHYTEKTDYAGRYDMWQHTDKGTVPGISGYVDMNIAYFGASKDNDIKAQEEEKNNVNEANKNEVKDNENEASKNEVKDNANEANKNEVKDNTNEENKNEVKDNADETNKNEVKDNTNTTASNENKNNTSETENNVTKDNNINTIVDNETMDNVKSTDNINE